MKNCLSKLTDGPDGEPCEMVILSILGVLTFIGLSIWAVVHDAKPFDYQAYGIGLGAALSAASIGIGIKNSKERPSTN